MTDHDRWTPDDQLIPAYLEPPRRRLNPLSSADRAWVVAGLTLAGKTADDIAERLGCSLRLVRSIRADPMTQICLFYQQESAAFSDELRLTRSEATAMARELSATIAELTRTRTQLANLIGPPRFRCGHPTDRYNVYEHNGRRYCRTCHRRHSAASRNGHANHQGTVGRCVGSAS